MTKRTVILGIVILTIALIFGAALGAAATYYFTIAQPAQASARSVVLMEHEEGVLIASVAEGSAAAQAGLVRGDILLEINGDEVDSLPEIWDILADLDPGEVAELTVMHGDELRSLEVTLGEREGAAFLGISTCNATPTILPLEEIDEQWLEELEGGRFFFRFFGAPGMPEIPFHHGEIELPEGIDSAAMIGEVLPDTPAEEAGLLAGDMILTLDGEPLDGHEDLADRIQAHDPGDEVSLMISREGKEIEVEATLSKHPDDSDAGYLGVVVTGYFKITKGKELDKFFDPEFEFEFQEKFREMELPGFPGGDA